MKTEDILSPSPTSSHGLSPKPHPASVTEKDLLEKFLRATLGQNLSYQQRGPATEANRPTKTGLPVTQSYGNGWVP